MNKFNLELCRNELSSNENIPDFTYRHESLNHSSYIDYIMITSDLIEYVYDFDILDVAINHSDHFPIFVKIQFNNVFGSMPMVTARQVKLNEVQSTL